MNISQKAFGIQKKRKRKKITHIVQLYEKLKKKLNK